jgi:hypothetical protein
MTNGTHANETGSTDPRHNAPRAATSARAGAGPRSSTQPVPAASHSVEHSRAGRGKITALYIVPGLLLLFLIIGYWAYSVSRANQQQEQNHNGSSRDDTTLPHTP